MGSLPACTVVGASAGLGETVELVFRSLGGFAFIFAFCVVVVLGFFIRGWLLLIRHTCPLDLDRERTPDQEDLLTRLVVEGGVDEDTIAQRICGGMAPHGNLFLRYLVRFSERDCPERVELAPSLRTAAPELRVLGRMQSAAKTVRFLSSVLPAIGLLGTLSGMFIAFHGTDFTQGDRLAETMAQLMENFALALWTTIVAVVLKIAVDLLCHFTLDTYIAARRDELVQLRVLLADVLHRHARGDSVGPAGAARGACAAPGVPETNGGRGDPPPQPGEKAQGGEEPDPHE